MANDAGTVLQTDRVTIPVLGTSWQQATAQVTAPAGTTRVSVELTHPTGQNQDFIYVDQIYVG